MLRILTKYWYLSTFLVSNRIKNVDISTLAMCLAIFCCKLVRQDNFFYTSYMKSIKLLLLVALKKEIPTCIEPKTCPVITLKAILSGDTRSLPTYQHCCCIVTGVGKYNATQAIEWALAHMKPELVINFGTAGSHKQEYYRHLLTPRYLQSSDSSIPVPSLGCFPFLTNSLIQACDNCMSVLKKDHTNECEIVDMEAYWEAYHCFQQSIPFCSLKYITDSNGADLQNQFNESISDAVTAFNHCFLNVLSPPPPIDISVIIPTYNRDSFLRRTIDSVLYQTSSCECLVIDDGSTDSTHALLSEYDSSIRCITHKTNQGVSVARNTGIHHCTGNWVMFLDSDDVWTPDKIEKQIAFAQDYSYYSVLQSEERWFRNGKHLNKKKYHAKKSGFIFDFCLERCLISPSSVMIKKDVFSQFGTFNTDLPVCEDYDLWLRLSRQLLVGLDPNVTLKKYGGHADQLSHSYSVMDRYRLYSLKSMIDAELHPFFKEKLNKTYTKKSTIIRQGALKRS